MADLVCEFLNRAGPFSGDPGAHGVNAKGRRRIGVELLFANPIDGGNDHADMGFLDWKFAIPTDHRRPLFP
jgi:hypothetical protein